MLRKLALVIWMQEWLGAITNYNKFLNNFSNTAYVGGLVFFKFHFRLFMYEIMNTT